MASLLLYTGRVYFSANLQAMYSIYNEYMINTMRIGI